MAKKTSGGKPKRDVQLHVMVSEDEDRDYSAAAEALGGVSKGAFIRQAANEKLQRMRAEGYKI